MEAGFQYRSRAVSTPPVEYFYTPCTRSKTSESNTTPYSVTRLRFPPRPNANGTYGCEATTPSPARWKRAAEKPSWDREDGRGSKPVHKPQTIEAWVNEQIHLTDLSNYERRTRPMAKEELRQRMWDELVYEYEAEAQKWMHHEAEMRRRAQEREREEARRRVVQEDIVRIQARVRQRRDSERQAIAEERRRHVERAREKMRKEQARSDRAMMDAWQTYESRWAAMSASSESLGFHDIPWPVLAAPERVADLTAEHITSFLLHMAHSSNQSRRERIRTALLRWHPDRFRRFLNRVADENASEVEEGVGIVVRCLNELLANEGKTPQQASRATQMQLNMLKRFWQGK